MPGGAHHLRRHSFAAARCNASDLNATVDLISHEHNDNIPSATGNVLRYSVMTERHSQCAVKAIYHASPWEQYWVANVKWLMDSSPKWSCGCRQVVQGRRGAHRWIQHVLHAREHWNCSAPTKWDDTVFSYHELIDSCTGKSVGRIPIEPLVGFLRNPRFEQDFCLRDSSWLAITSKTYFLPQWRCEADARVPTAARPRGRSYFFDLGASLFWPPPYSKTGGSSQPWFVSEYRKRGLEFDRVLAWEANPYTPQQIFAMPPRDLDRLSYMNVPVNTTPGALHNPLRMLRALCSEDDFVVVKIDIDTNHIEEALIEQIVAEPGLASLIDEVYFEHHVWESPMFYKGWLHSLQESDGTPKTSHTLADSYRLFSRMRHLGIRAHSWV